MESKNRKKYINKSENECKKEKNVCFIIFHNWICHWIWNNGEEEIFLR